MLLEMRIVAAGVLLCATGGLAALPSQPDTGRSAITDALCGRQSRESSRAKALDDFNPAAVPSVWRDASVEELELWSGAHGCDEGVLADSTRRFNRRTRKLGEIREHLAAAKEMETVRQSLLSLTKRQPKAATWTDPREWPEAGECPECAALRHAGVVATRAASHWRERSGNPSAIGARLDTLRDGQVLVAELCAARPPSGAAEAITARFRYYTWTVDGAWLLAVAQWFEQSKLQGRCHQ